MQHVLRCWERQSDGSEYQKTLRRPGLRPGPRSGSLQRSRQLPSWWGWAGCPLPKNPIPRSRPFGPRLSYPHSKISSNAVVGEEVFVGLSRFIRRISSSEESDRGACCHHACIPLTMSEMAMREASENFTGVPVCSCLAA